ncbi:MAG: class I SAM-dependent methyltransferase [Planctomycetes bacterium]|nr:class I SAM-dependent methyltransferase [Planctomycetota bacterium]MCP4772390.1 class I SAM-dependent methyltransferase [Planctomycetota bacterium]MCP4861510.1 class I SAM-dependent methyltransferase [Planctomycetota bacterium]
MSVPVAAPPTSEHFIACHGFPPYMHSILEALALLPAGSRILDIPSGRGQFSDALREAGLDAVSADLNGQREDYLPLDMSAPLPLEDASFDAVVCTEGLEHLLAPQSLVEELVRIVKPGGSIYLSVPNVHNFYSRLQFLFTGTLFQFQAYDVPDTPRTYQGDRCHVTPITFPQLRWWAWMAGAEVVELLADKEKRKLGKPLYWMLHQLGRPWRRKLEKSGTVELEARNQRLQEMLNSKKTLYARSLVLHLKRK